MRKLMISILVSAVLSPVASGDIIVFKSGVAKRGVIEEETPASVKIRIEDSVLGVSRANIEKIEYATPEENMDLLMQWKEKRELLKEKRMKQKEEEKKFEKEQRDKGFVQVDGKWVSPADAEQMSQEGIQRRISVKQDADAAKESAGEP